MTSRDPEFWAIAEHESLRGERVIQASFDDRAIGVARFILFGEGSYSGRDFFAVGRALSKDYEIDFDEAVEALDISEGRQIRELVNGEA